MDAKKRAGSAAALPLLLIGLCAAAPAMAQSAQGSARSVSDRGLSRHVVVISVDGLRPDAIERFELETLRRLAREGAEAADARTIMPSRTLPSHTSMLTGLLPEDHGITFNRELADEDNVTVPTIFEMARRRGLTTAAFFSKAKFRHLHRPEAYDYWQAPESNMDNWMATRTIPDAVQYLRHERPNLLFVHIGEPDYAGHATGWMSFFYGWAARRADAAVGRVVEAAEDVYGAGNYTVIVTADHGGHGTNHGTEMSEDVRIPWIVWGRGVSPDAHPEGVRTVDTAATALWLLGLTVPAHWEGRPVRSAFVGGAAAPVVVEAGT